MSAAISGFGTYYFTHILWLSIIAAFIGAIFGPIIFTED